MKQNLNNNLENLKDIIASISVVIKLFPETEILESQTNLVMFLSELGFKTHRGKDLTIMNFRTMFNKLSLNDRKEIFKEFDIQRMNDLVDVMVDE